MTKFFYEVDSPDYSEVNASRGPERVILFLTDGRRLTGLHPLRSMTTNEGEPVQLAWMDDELRHFKTLQDAISHVEAYEFSEDLSELKRLLGREE